MTVAIIVPDSLLLPLLFLKKNVDFWHHSHLTGFTELQSVVTMYPMDGSPAIAQRRTCTVEVRVRYAECDSMGYLHHARYWEYFEHARTELLRRSGVRYRDLEDQGVLFVVYKCACKYIAPVRYDDVVNVTATVTRTTRTRVDHAYTVDLAGKRTCEASTTLACVGRDGRPILMPESLW